MIENSSVLFFKSIKCKTTYLAQAVGCISVCIKNKKAAQSNFPAGFFGIGQGWIGKKLGTGNIGCIIYQFVDIPADETGPFLLGK